VFLDAVRHGRVFAEDNWPNEVLYLLNIFQEQFLELGGAQIDTDEMPPIATLEQINVTTDGGWNHNLLILD